MAFSPVKFLFLLLSICIFGWVLFMFAARLLAWLFSRVLGATVGFRIASFNCLRDVTLKFKKGSVESLTIGEFKLSLRKTLVKLGAGFVSKDPKLQLLISDLEIVLRHSEKNNKRKKLSSPKSHSASRGKWMVLANMARYLSVSLVDLTVKMPKAIIEVKDIALDIFKNGGSTPILVAKLHLYPFILHLVESRMNPDQWSCILEGQPCSFNAEKNLSPFRCEELLMTCEFGHDRDTGCCIKNVEIASGEVTLNLNEDILKNNKKQNTDVRREISSDDTPSLKSKGDKDPIQSLKKYLLVFPEKFHYAQAGCEAHGSARYSCGK